MSNLKLSPAEAARHLLSRRRARNSLQGFTEYTTERWTAGKIHREICAQLDRVERGEIDRLLLLCPPQHGKSQVASRRYPAYLLGRNPHRDVISASATADLAGGFGRDVRNCLASPEYQCVFPGTRLAQDSQAKDLWHTQQGGSYYAVGVGGKPFGRGGMGIIDDPFGSWADAQNELQRDRVWDWYQGTFYNRIRPGEPIIVIQHRMHEEDLAGRLIERQKAGADEWKIVELPAFVDDPPWIERYDRPALERIRANTDPRQWSALYLQNPTPDEGTFFKREWFELYDPRSAPQAHRYTSGDFAVTEGGGDFTELATHAFAGDTLWLAVEGWRGQTTPDVWFERLCDQFERHHPLAFFGETGPIKRSIEPFLTKRMRERKAYCRLEWLTRGHDKPTMARPLQAMAAMKRVKIADTEYGHQLLNQMLTFPAGRWDDGVDMAALMGLALDQAHPAVLTSPVVPLRKRDGYEGAEPEDSWKVA